MSTTPFLRTTMRPLALAIGAVLASSAFAAGPAVRVAPLGTTRPRVAVLPVDNLSANQVPLAQLRADMAAALAAKGVDVVDATPVDDALARLRVRWVGGVDDETAAELKRTTGADAVLVTTVEAWDTGDPPHVAIEGRLVGTEGNVAQPIWATAALLAGDDTPGLLDLKLVHDPAVLAARAIERIAGEMGEVAHGGGRSTTAVTTPDGERRFRPRALFVSKQAPAFGVRVRRIAVLPFINDTPRRYAGEIAELQFVRELIRMGGVEVIEPGRVRKVLLDARVIQEGGLSLPQADLLKASLDVDMVVAGTVLEFKEAVSGGVPVVELSPYGIDTARRQVAWIAHEYVDGQKGVHWFELGSVRSSGRLVAEVTRATLSEVVRRSRAQ